LPTSGIAALTNLTSLDIGSSDYMPEDLDLDQGQLQQLQRVLGGLDKLVLGCFTDVQDASLLASIGCTDLCFGGFRGCAAPAGCAALLPSSVVRLQLTSQGALCPLLLRQAGLTSLRLAEEGCDDDDCEALAGAFPQLWALQLTSDTHECITAGGLAHLSALQHLGQLSLIWPCSTFQPAELQALAGISSMRRLVISLSRNEQVREVEEAQAGLGAGAKGLGQVLLTVESSCGKEQREALQAACDRVVARCGRQELVMEVRRQIWDSDVWEWMLAHPVAE
jgi:hypothetical protein